MSEFDASGGSSNARPASGAFDQDCKGTLHVVIENQIIPRLLNVLPMDSANAQAWSVDWPLGERPEFLAFTQLCLQNDAAQANRFVDGLMDRGLTPAQVFMELVTPAARHLGVLWDRDECDFTQVTCGLAIMHQMIYRLGYETPTAALNEGEQESVMLACAPGSQHFLGLTIVADLYRKAGANVVLEISSTESELLRAVSHEWFDVVGISVALAAQLQTLPSLIAHLREQSGNPQVKVVLGGPVFLFNPITAQALGADAIFTDAQAALQALKHPARLLRSD
jgi:MerR family transcriptional regulator, light-induced transcriptional regulator